tara:strand:- start:172 stop:939 length:768 start_codon:yes stop_codon:yes gene_type:complete
MVKKMNQRGQVTIFIILAMIIVIGIAILFVLIKKPDLQIEDVESPQAYIESCTRDFVEEAIGILSKQGGDIEPEGSVMYKGKDITYLCYTSTNYATCLNQRPMLIEHIQQEITDYISPKVENCFQQLKIDLEKKNYVVEIGNMNLKTKLQTRQVLVNIDRDFKMTKRESTRDFKNFKMSLVNPIYDLAKIANEITNQQAKYCHFSELGFMIFYPQYNIEKIITGDADIIYKTTDKNTNQQFTFAIRTCPMPGGLA